jgi:hypothetical protein
MFIPVVGLDNCEPHDLELDISTPAYEAQIADWTSGAGLSLRGTTANCMIAGVQAEIGMRTKDMIHVPCWENGAPLTVPEYTMMGIVAPSPPFGRVPSSCREPLAEIRWMHYARDDYYPIIAPA